METGNKPPQQQGQSLKGQKPGQKRTAPAGPGGPKYGAPQSRGKEIMFMPFVFFFFLFGLANLLTAPVAYVYEVIAYNKKNEWPGWSGMDGVNYAFLDPNRPLFINHGKLYRGYIGHGAPPPTAVFDTHLLGPVGQFLNDSVVWYLDCSVIVICLLQGILFLTLSVRTSIKILGA
jgi:hypothetical protein